MKTYKYTDSTNQVVHIIDEDGISRSSCLASILEPGTDILPADPLPIPSIIASPRQIRQALTAIGLRAQVEAAVVAGNQDLKDWWEFATQFEEDHPMVVGMATQLGVLPTDLHNLFVLASSL